MGRALPQCKPGYGIPDESAGFSPPHSFQTIQKVSPAAAPIAAKIGVPTARMSAGTSAAAMNPRTAAMVFRMSGGYPDVTLPKRSD